MLSVISKDALARGPQAKWHSVPQSLWPLLRPWPPFALRAGLFTSSLPYAHEPPGQILQAPPGASEKAPISNFPFPELLAVTLEKSCQWLHHSFRCSLNMFSYKPFSFHKA